MEINLQQLWTLVLPLIVFVVSYVIQQEKWQPEINGLIALIMVIIATAASLLLQGGNITDASVVAAFSTALQSEALAPLMPYLRAAPSAPTQPAAIQPMQPPSPPATQPVIAMSSLPPSPKQNTSNGPE